MNRLTTDALLERAGIHQRIGLVDFGERLRQKREKQGLTQAEMARKIGRDRSRIVRVEAGDITRLDRATAQAYAEFYGLNKQETRDWFQLLFGVFPESATLSSYLVEALEDNYVAVRHTNTLGDRRLTLKLARTAAHRIQRLLLSDSSPRVAGPLTRLLSRLLAEQADAYRQLLLPHEIMHNQRRFAGSVHRIADETGNAEMFGLGCLILGDAYYVAGKYERSLEWLAKAEGLLRDAGDRATLLRVSTLDWAYLNRSDMLEEQERKTRGFIDHVGRGNDDLGLIPFLLEGLGRAQGLLKSEMAFDTFDAAQDILVHIEEEKQRMPFRRVQLARSKLEVLLVQAPNDTQSIQTTAKEGLVLAKEQGYQRHAHFLDHALEENVA